MKKSTIILLLVVFLGSVVIVGVFGMQAVPFEKIVYVKEIIPTSVATISGEKYEIKQDDKGYYVRIPYQEGMKVVISTRVEPADATFKELKITIRNNPEDNPIAQIGEKGEIIFLRRGSVQLHFGTKDSASFKGLDFWIYTYVPTT